MNGVVKKRKKRGFRLKDVIAALFEISDEGVFNFKNLAVKATMYVPVQGRTSSLASFFMKHTTEKGCKTLCREAVAMGSLRVSLSLTYEPHPSLRKMILPFSLKFPASPEKKFLAKESIQVCQLIM